MDSHSFFAKVYDLSVEENKKVSKKVQDDDRWELVYDKVIDRIEDDDVMSDKLAELAEIAEIVEMTPCCDVIGDTVDDAIRSNQC